MLFRVHSIFQSNGENMADNDVKRLGLGWKWTREHLSGLLLWVSKSQARKSTECRTHEMNTELSQSFFGGLILGSLLSVSSPAADAISIYNCPNDLLEASAQSQESGPVKFSPKLASS